MWRFRRRPWAAIVLALQASTEACRELQAELASYRALTALRGR